METILRIFVQNRKRVEPCLVFKLLCCIALEDRFSGYCNFVVRCSYSASDVLMHDDIVTNYFESPCELWYTRTTTNKKRKACPSGPYLFLRLFISVPHLTRTWALEALRERLSRLTASPNDYRRFHHLPLAHSFPLAAITPLMRN